MTGNRVSHSNKKTKVRLEPNLQVRKFWSEAEKRYVRLRLSTAGIREIDKRGLDAVLRDVRARGVKV
jgi:large subunit ribosomal protein L28